MDVLRTFPNPINPLVETPHVEYRLPKKSKSNGSGIEFKTDSFELIRKLTVEEVPAVATTGL